MFDIIEIMDMLDWHMPLKIQQNGVELAKKTELITPFIQPLTPKYNKNVWENCSAIIASNSDEKLKPYLVDLLEWLQDLNWPGAIRTLERLKKYSDRVSMCDAIEKCINKAKNSNDVVWLNNLSLLE